MLIDDSDLRTKLEKMLSPERLAHSHRVADLAVELARLHGADEDKARLAGYLHDCGRMYPIEDMVKTADSLGLVVDSYEREYPLLLHERIGELVARQQLGVEDEDVLSAIACHTTGKAEMSLLDMIIYLADYAEPKRRFDGVKLARKACLQNLDEALLLAVSQVIRHLLTVGRDVHPRTLACRDWILGKVRD